MPKANERESGSFPVEVQTEIRKQAAQQAAKWSIAGAVTLLAIAAAG